MIAAAIKQQLDGSAQNHLDSVLENELDKLQQRVAETAKGEFFFYVTDSASLLSIPLPISSPRIEYKSGT